MRLPKRILVAHDFSEISTCALDHAIALGKASGASLVVFNAYGEALETPAALGAVERAARDALEQALASRRSPAIEISGVCRWTEPVAGILQTALEAKSDLIVLGTHGRHGMARAFLGSIAESVVRASTCPVLLIHGPRGDQPAPRVSPLPRRIVVPTDFGEVSERALDASVELAAQVGASITLVHAYTNPMLGPGSAVAISADLIGQIVESARAALRDAAAARSASGVPIATELGQAPAAPVALEIAERADADLIALGTRGRTGIGRALFGSVAEAIIRHATRPVLVFTRPEK